MNQDELLHLGRIRHRMEAVAVLGWAICLRNNWDTAPPMTMHVNGQLVLEGNLNAFTNPVIEAGLVHCRALLEFLGLRERNGQLCQRKDTSRRSGDVGIECFSHGGRSLPMVDPEAAVARYGGQPEEARQSLLSVFHLTNKGVAHVTHHLTSSPENGRLIEIASRGLPALMISYFYTPLGLPAPDYKIMWRPAGS